MPGPPAGSLQQRAKINIFIIGDSQVSVRRGVTNKVGDVEQDVTMSCEGDEN